MLTQTYERVLKLFKEHNGYMSFAELREGLITVNQMRELEERGAVERFSRGWYWCKALGKAKPKDYKFLELGMAVPESVICGLSACYINGIIDTEPDVVTYVTDYDSRRVNGMNYETKKFYHNMAEWEGKVKVKHTKYGDYSYLDKEEAIRDCIHCRNKIDPVLYDQVINWALAQKSSKYRELGEAAKRL